MSRRAYTYNSDPAINRPRSPFNLSYIWTGTFNVGDLVPMYLQEVYPGDTFECHDTIVARVLSSYKKPIMDQLVCDTYYFYVPDRIVYNDFTKVFGENDESAWVNQKEYVIPTQRLDNNNIIYKNTIADYMGIQPGNYADSPLDVTELPFRSFALIYNYWFRNQNITDPCHINFDSNLNGSFNNNDFGPDNILGKCPKVTRMSDYFSSCLPAPQKADPVAIMSSTGNMFPVDTGATHSVNIGTESSYPHLVNADTGGIQGVSGYLGSVTNNLLADGTSFVPETPVKFDNLWADPTGIPFTTVNDIREAFALQRMFERDMMGTRYKEYLEAHFSTYSGDARLQYPEYLGGKRFALGTQQVANTADALGDLGAYSLSNGNSGFFKGFVEHGFIIGVACVRYKHTYSQGVERFWTRKTRLDFYDPCFQNIGEQPVYGYELSGPATGGNIIFGYNRAWNDLRCRTNKVTSELRVSAGSGLESYTFADNYLNTPTLTDDFINENAGFVDKTLNVAHTVAPQLLFQVGHDVKATRCMSKYAMPGLIDHM